MQMFYVMLYRHAMVLDFPFSSLSLVQLDFMSKIIHLHSSADAQWWNITLLLDQLLF